MEPVVEPAAGPSLSRKRRLARKAKRNTKKFNLEDDFKKYCSASGKFPKIKFYIPLKKKLFFLSKIILPVFPSRFSV
jgi:hypothetical protein